MNICIFYTFITNILFYRWRHSPCCTLAIVRMNDELSRWWWWCRRDLTERTVQLRTLPLVPSPTGLHPARGDSGVCMCILVCLVWSVFPTAFRVPTSLASVPTATHWQPSPIRLHLDLEKCTYEVGRFLPHRGSNSGRQISGPVLYRLSYSVLKWAVTIERSFKYPALTRGTAFGSRSHLHSHVAIVTFDLWADIMHTLNT